MVDVDYYLIFADRRARRLLNTREYVIGREAGVDIHLQDALISRRHMTMLFDADAAGWKAVDLQSRNGVLVNGQRIAGEQLLEDGDQIQISGQVFSYYLVPPGSDLGMITKQAPEISGQITMAPGMSLSDMAKESAAFRGLISENGLLELLQFFSMTKKTGRLDLVDLNGAYIWIDDGTPRDAAYKNETGFDALLSLVTTPGARFAFNQDILPPQGPQITGAVDGILMDIARLIDEAGR